MAEECIHGELCEKDAEVLIRLIDDFNSKGAAPADELAVRITEYLSAGGLWNPESMEHDKIRDLLIACRDRLAQPPPATHARQIDVLNAIYKVLRPHLGAKATDEIAVEIMKEIHDRTAVTKSADLYAAVENAARKADADLANNIYSSDETSAAPSYVYRSGCGTPALCTEHCMAPRGRRGAAIVPTRRLDSRYLCFQAG